MTTVNAGTENIQVLGNLILVQLDIRGSDLEAKLDRKTDLAGVAMPPETIVSAGVKRFASPELKRPFDRIAKQAERLCREAGIPILSGWAIPPERAKDLHKELLVLRADYLDEANALQDNWDAHCQAWENKPEHAADRDLLRRGRPEASTVRARYRFSHTMYRIQSASDDALDPINEGLIHQEGSIVDVLLEDIAVNATRILEKSFEGKEQVQRRAIQPIAAMADKLRSFAMVDPLVYPTAELIAEVVASLPLEGKLSRVETSAVRGLLELLNKPAKVKAHGYGVIAQKNQSLPDDEPAEPATTAPSIAPASPAKPRTAVRKSPERAPDPGPRKALVL